MCLRCGEAQDCRCRGIAGRVSAPASRRRSGKLRSLSTDARIATMGKGRLEAFSDGVIAIIITIMVLDLRAPHGQTADIASLRPLIPVFLGYVDVHLLASVALTPGTRLWTRDARLRRMADSLGFAHSDSAH